MSLKTVRVCDQCNRETSEKESFFIVRLSVKDPALAQPFSARELEVCSLSCLAAATGEWIALRSTENR